MIILLAGGVLILSACTLSSLPEGEKYFIPPSLDPQASPLVLETATGLPASPTPPCDNHMVFLLDVTVPDGSVFAPGEQIDKVWQVRNEGTCSWGGGYTIGLEEGPPLGLLIRHEIPETLPGESAQIQVSFTAPEAPGNYRSSWRAQDGGKNAFGVLIYIEITVSDD